MVGDVKGVLAFVCMVMLGFSSFAQQTSADFKRTLYRHEQHFGAGIHTSGFGLEFVRSVRPIGRKQINFKLDWVSMKHPKEVKVYHPFYESARGYYYGKMNGFSITRLGVGQTIPFSEKTDRGSVALSFHYAGGYAHGWLKPVYLEIIRQETNSDRTYLSTERYDPAEHFVENIYGRASWLTGFDAIKFQPGAWIKSGIQVEYGRMEEKVSLLDMGVALDFFPSPVPIMASDLEKRLFLNLYMTLHVGNRWN